jgi:dTDP-glucose 4,6-dehydratase
MFETYPSLNIVNLDALTYAGNIENLKDIKENTNYNFIHGDVCCHSVIADIIKEHNIDTIVHFAAESHVDRSIFDGSQFVLTNVLGTYNVVDNALKYDIEKVIHVSTDEVYGSLYQGSFSEKDRLVPSSLYASSKAASDLIALSFFTTHKLPVLITRCSNNFGFYQHPEKLIPLFITNLIDGQKVPVYGKGDNVREWLFVMDHCRAIDFLLNNGIAGEIYNIGSGIEKTNMEITQLILELLDKDQSMIEYVPDRKGHDFRYSLDCHKLLSMGWKPKYGFDEALAQTVDWYLNNEEWWRPLKEVNEIKN